MISSVSGPGTTSVELTFQESPALAAYTLVQDQKLDSPYVLFSKM